MPDRPLRILAIEPYYGGSHRHFLDHLIRHSRHEWSLLTGKPVHWKWRMRSGALELAAEANSWRQHQPCPDLLFVSDMLDLPSWRGLVGQAWVQDLPAVVYFHESQWTYPIGPHAQLDLHYGYTNLLTALAADACWFNSQFHQQQFLTESESFVGRMPDAQAAHHFSQLKQKCQVIPPGFQPPNDLPVRSSRHEEALKIGWVSRWEHDKRPDVLLELISRLAKSDLDFRLILMGARPAKEDDSLREIRKRFEQKILFDGFAQDESEYWSWLASMDVVVSTADHEFFGIAVCEAIWAGAVPVVPDRLSYVELVEASMRYKDLDQAVALINRFTDPPTRRNASHLSKSRIEALQIERLAPKFDEAFENVTNL